MIVGLRPGPDPIDLCADFFFGGNARIPVPLILREYNSCCTGSTGIPGRWYDILRVYVRTELDGVSALSCLIIQRQQSRRVIGGGYHGTSVLRTAW